MENTVYIIKLILFQCVLQKNVTTFQKQAVAFESPDAETAKLKEAIHHRHHHTDKIFVANAIFGGSASHLYHVRQILVTQYYIAAFTAAAIASDGGEEGPQILCAHNPISVSVHHIKRLPQRPHLRIISIGSALIYFINFRRDEPQNPVKLLKIHRAAVVGVGNGYHALHFLSAQPLAHAEAAAAEEVLEIQQTDLPVAIFVHYAEGLLHLPWFLRPQFYF